MAEYIRSGATRAPSAVADINAASAAVRSVTTSVDASAGGTAQTAAIVTVPAGSLILGVEAEVITPFDGDTTTTLEVGVGGNIDAYIDTTDFDPSAAAGTKAGSVGGANNDVVAPQYVSAATPIIATWTNTANASEGEVEVRVLYIPFDNVELGTQVNALLSGLRSTTPSAVLPTS